MREGTEEAIERKFSLGRMFSFYGELLSASQREMCALYLEEDLTMAQIAAQLSVTRQGVHDMLTRTFAKLEEYEHKLGMCRRFEGMEQGLDSLMEMLTNIAPAPGSERMLQAAIDKTKMLCRLEELE